MIIKIGSADCRNACNLIVRLSDDVIDQLEFMLARENVAPEFIAAKHPVGRHRYVGQGDGRHGPGNRSLGSSGVHYRVNRGKQPENLEYHYQGYNYFFVLRPLFRVLVVTAPYLIPCAIC